MNTVSSTLVNQMQATDKKKTMRRVGLKLVLGVIVVAVLYVSISQQWKQRGDKFQRENLIQEQTSDSPVNSDVEANADNGDEQAETANEDTTVSNHQQFQGEDGTDFQFAETENTEHGADEPETENEEQGKTESHFMSEEADTTDPAPPTLEPTVMYDQDEEGGNDEENLEETQNETDDEGEETETPNDEMNQASSQNDTEKSKESKSLFSFFDLSRFLPFGNKEKQENTVGDDTNDAEIDYDYDEDDNEKEEQNDSSQHGIVGGYELEAENQSLAEEILSQDGRLHFDGIDMPNYVDAEDNVENNINYEKEADDNTWKEDSKEDTGGSLTFGSHHISETNGEDENDEEVVPVILVASKTVPDVRMRIVGDKNNLESLDIAGQQKASDEKLMDILRSRVLERLHDNSLTPQLLEDVQLVMKHYKSPIDLSTHSYIHTNEEIEENQNMASSFDQFNHVSAADTAEASEKADAFLKNLDDTGFEATTPDSLVPGETTTHHGDVYDNPRPLSDQDFAMLRTTSFKQDPNFLSTASTTDVALTGGEPDRNLRQGADQHDYGDGSDRENNLKYDYYGRLVTDGTNYNGALNTNNEAENHTNLNVNDNNEEQGNAGLHQIPIDDKGSNNPTTQEDENSNTTTLTDDDVDICPREVKLAKTSHPVTALVAFPGADTTWLKKVLEQLTGETTDNIYSIMARLKSGDAAGVYQMGKNLAIETHAATTKNFDKAVVVLSNPFAVEARHRVFRPYSNEWQKSFLWAKTYTEWLSSDIPLFVLTYEDLVDSPVTELFKVAAFLNGPGMRISYRCALEVASSPPHLVDDVREIAGIYRDDRRRINENINQVIEVARTRHPEILARLESYKVYSG